MIEIIVLYFLCKQMGAAALQKGLKPSKWKILTVVAWITGEFAGLIMGVMLFGFDQNNLLGLMAFAVACAFGGYLLVRASLEKMPSIPQDN